MTTSCSVTTLIMWLRGKIRKKASTENQDQLEGAATNQTWKLIWRFTQARNHIRVTPVGKHVVGHQSSKLAWESIQARNHVCVRNVGFRANAACWSTEESTQPRPYTCEPCGKAFRLTCHLKVHTRIHTVRRSDTAVRSAGKSARIASHLANRMESHPGK